jgi:hypothetical protein
MLENKTHGPIDSAEDMECNVALQCSALSMHDRIQLCHSENERNERRGV